MLPCVSCLFFKDSPISQLLAPAKEGYLIGSGKALPMFPVCAQKGYMMHGWAVCHKSTVILLGTQLSLSATGCGQGRVKWETGLK